MIKLVFLFFLVTSLAFGGVFFKNGSLIEQITQVVSSGTTTTLVPTDNTQTYITGTDVHTFKLPDATLMASGRKFYFYNKSTMDVDIQASDASALNTIPADSAGVFTLVDNATAVGVWVCAEFFGTGGITVETDPLALKIANNLSDLTDLPTARTNLGLGLADSPTLNAINLEGAPGVVAGHLLLLKNTGIAIHDNGSILWNQTTDDAWFAGFEGSSGNEYGLWFNDTYGADPSLFSQAFAFQSDGVAKLTSTTSPQLELREVSGTPSNAADPSHSRFYFKTDNRLYSRNESGVEFSYSLASEVYTKTELDSGQLDAQYFQESEFLNISAGAGDAGKPIKLDASGLVHSSMLPAGGGDVVGPGSSVDGHVAVFDGVTGKLLKDGGPVNIDGMPFTGPGSTAVNGMFAAGSNACAAAISGTVAGIACNGRDAGQFATGPRSMYWGQFSGGSIIGGDDNTSFGYQSMQATISTLSNSTCVGTRSCQSSQGTTHTDYGHNAGRNNDGSSVMNFGSGAGENGQGNATLVFIADASGATFNGLTSFSAANEIAFGGPNAFYADVYWGQGGSSASPSQVIHHITNAEGSDISAATGHFVIAPARGTGTGGGGFFKVQTAEAGLTGSSLNTLVDRFIIRDTGEINILSDVLEMSGTQVLGAQITGWTVATGTATRTAFDTSTVTTAQLAERVKALIDDFHATAGHGLIGN